MKDRVIRKIEVPRNPGGIERQGQVSPKLPVSPPPKPPKQPPKEKK